MRNINTNLFSNRKSHRRGSAVVYTTIALPAMIAVVSLAVDLGRVQTTKAEMQRCVDASARGHLALFAEYGLAAASASGPLIAKYNAIDGGATPTMNVEWGWWDPVGRNFYSTSGGVNWPRSVRVTAARTKKNGNGVGLMFASVLGFGSVDLTTRAVATLNSPTTANVPVPATADPYLAGMPAGATASYDDTAPANTPTAVAIDLIPGGYVSFNNVNGKMRHNPKLADFGPEGDPTRIYSHGIDSPGGPTPPVENGIADIKMPICGMMGLFLDDNKPSTTAAPGTRDYTSVASRNQNFYDDIKLKQPFFIGDGLTSGGAVQQFRVPAGATRLYICVMDGYEWANNVGGFNATVKVVETITLVQ